MKLFSCKGRRQQPIAIYTGKVKKIKKLDFFLSILFLARKFHVHT